MITAAIEIEVVREVPEAVEIDAAVAVVDLIVRYRTTHRARNPTVDQDRVPLKGAAAEVNMTVVVVAKGPIVAVVVVDEVPRIEEVMAPEENVGLVVGDREGVEAVRGVDHDRLPNLLPLLRLPAKGHRIPWQRQGPSLLFPKISVQSSCRNSSCEQQKKTFVVISEER